MELTHTLQIWCVNVPQGLIARGHRPLLAVRDEGGVMRVVIWSISDRFRDITHFVHFFIFANV